MVEPSCMPGPSSLTSDITYPNPSNSAESDPRCREGSADHPKATINTSPGAMQLHSWLNKSLRIEMTDGRVLVGVFLCTDRDANIILGSCSEYLPESDEEPRMLGLVMIPGKHIVTVHINVNTETHMDELEAAIPKNVKLCEESEFT